MNGQKWPCRLEAALRSVASVLEAGVTPTLKGVNKMLEEKGFPPIDRARLDSAVASATWRKQRI